MILEMRLSFSEKQSDLMHFEEQRDFHIADRVKSVLYEPDTTALAVNKPVH